MKNKLLFFFILMIFSFFSCNHKNSTGNGCNSDLNAFLELTHQLEGTQNSGTIGMGGATLIQYNSSDVDTLFLNFGFDNGNVYSFQAAIINPTGEGSYTFGSITNVVLVWNNISGICYDLTVNINELGSTVSNPFNPNTPNYNRINGTFSGLFAWSSPDTISYSGSFCSVLP